MEPMSPALAGRFLTPVPPENPLNDIFKSNENQLLKYNYQCFLKLYFLSILNNKIKEHPSNYCNFKSVMMINNVF